MTATVSPPAGVGTRTALLVANGDLRESANVECWPAQAQLERHVADAFASIGWQVERAHPVDTEAGHGFIGSQSQGRDVFATIDPDAPLVVAEAVWHLVHGPLPAGTLRDEPIDALGARCIYLHDADAEQRLLERFPQARPVALQALLVKTAMARATDRPAVLVHRTGTTCDLVIAHPDRVLLSNSYLAPTATDVLYFTLFALDRAGVRPETVRPVLCGASFTAEELTLMNTYLPTPVEHHDRPLPAEDRWLAVLQQWSCA